MNIQICLVSQQVIQNILPVLELKPDLLIFLYTKEFEKKVDWLSSVLKKRLPNLQFEKIQTQALDFDSVVDSCKEILAKFPNENFTLNLTGGTKIMALASFSAFENSNVIYCNSEENQILKIDSYPVKKIEISNSLSIQEYLQANSFQIVAETLESKILSRKALAMFLGENNSKILDFLQDCRRALSGKEDYSFPIVHSDPEIKVSETSKNDILKVNIFTNGNRLEFEVERKFVNGHWLEEYVFWKLKNKGFSPKLGIHIYNGNVKNEIDVCLIQKNKLFWISCKSGDFKNTDIAEVEQFKKLIGGTFGKGFFVTSNKIGELEHRAKELQIEVIDSKNFQQLAQIIGEN